ncbi:multiple sugar transport system permease protein [Conyzicola nivalis]|uniref:Multiple sugar transport system permease protein n=1 Tax=Conyzicola nivalis TaxID=1477021 RepID=A0ABV2QQG5_9MICO
MTTLDTELAPVLPLDGKPVRSKTSWKKRKTWATVVWAVVLVAIVAVVLYPLLWMVLASFKPSADINGNVALFPENPTIQNYVKVLQGIGGIPVYTFFLNSLLLAVGSVIGVIISSSMAAYAFARVRFAGSKVFFGLMIATLLLPFHVLIIPQYIIFQRLGLVDTFVPLLVVKFLATEAFFVFLMVQFIRNLPMELDEAARIDGAGHPRVFFSITLPLIKPALVTSAIFAFIWSWNDFLGPLLYLNSTDKYPLPLALRLYNDQTSVSDYGATIAISVLALIPIALFFFIFQRFLVEGVATQGLKG